MEDYTKVVVSFLFIFFIAPLFGKVSFYWYSLVIGDYMNVTPPFFMGFIPIAFGIISMIFTLAVITEERGK